MALSELARYASVGFVLGLTLSTLLSDENASAGTERRRRRRRRLEGAAKCEGIRQSGWSKMELVDRLESLQSINPDVPASIQTGPDHALLLSDRGFSECHSIAVAVVHSGAGKCLLLAESDDASYRSERRELVDDEWKPISRIREARQRMPSDVTRRRATTLSTRLLSKRDELAALLEPLLAAAAKRTDPAYSSSTKGGVLVMCVNSGNLDLLLNFVLSAKCRGIDVSNLVVFAADDAVDRALRSAGIVTFRHPALGDFRAEAAGRYGDHQFVEMMWLKMTCVFLVVDLGYDVLFQDADLVWWKSPWEEFAKRPDIDTFWMDDGARTSRFAPHFPNTGFYLIRSNQRTRLFNNQLIGAYASVLAWQSHQAVVSQLLAEAHALYGVTVKILDKIQFPSGKQLHHNRPLFDKIHAKTFFPFCFHMCWTAGKADKLKFLKQENLWYLPPSCSLDNMLNDPEIVAKCANQCPS